jgi:hypothetical protein
LSVKHKFEFTLEKIEQQINALYATLADGEDVGVHDAKFKELQFYFECLADSLQEAGAYASNQEAGNHIRADIDVLQMAGGPDGLLPDDGLLTCTTISMHRGLAKPCSPKVQDPLNGEKAKSADSKVSTPAMSRRWIMRPVVRA